MLSSMQGQWFYEQDFAPLPAEIDVGHPPLLPAYLACAWHVFGKSLPVSHWAMLPFLFGIVAAAHRLARLLVPPNDAVCCAALMLLHPTLLAQCSLVSPDVLLVLFFLLAAGEFFKKNASIHRPDTLQHVYSKGFYALWLAALALTSLRGTIAVGMIFCAEFTLLFLQTHSSENKPHTASNLALKNLAFANTVLPYLPAIVLFLAWYAWHQATTGAVGWHNPNAPEFYRSLTDGAGLLKNYAVFVWRLLDFGAMAVWMVLGIGIITAYWDSKLKTLLTTPVFVLLGVMLLLWLPVIAVVPISSIGHRYFLPVQLLASIGAVLILQAWSLRLRQRIRQSIIVACLLALSTGHVWALLYPSNVAKGWDSTLAYLPYDALRSKVLQTMTERGIHPSDVASRNCGVFSEKYIRLNDSNDATFREQPIAEARYVFWSSVLNGFSDEDLRRLQEWECVERAEAWGIAAELRKNPRFP